MIENVELSAAVKPLLLLRDVSSHCLAPAGV
jgi:hypothetical protein